MFSLFRSKTERKVRKLERAMMTMAIAADKENWALFEAAAGHQARALDWLNRHGEWSPYQVSEYLKERGLARLACDEAYAAKVKTAYEAARRKRR